MTHSVLVDSSVILDVVTEDEAWLSWSSETLAACADQGMLLINPVIYAEVSVGFDRIEEVDEAISPDYLRRESIPYEAAFLAGKCFLDYRRRGGKRSAPLPDFFIGAHAAIRGYTLLTRDPGRIRTYYPTVTLIAPDGA